MVSEFVVAFFFHSLQIFIVNGVFLYYYRILRRQNQKSLKQQQPMLNQVHRVNEDRLARQPIVHWFHQQTWGDDQV